MSRPSRSLLFLSLLWFSIATRLHCSRHKDVGAHFEQFRNQLYPSRPVNLPGLPDFKNDVPERQRTFFGVAPTRYETIIVRETVRPVCLLVDGNVPSCDHVIQNHNNDDGGNHDRPKTVAANVRRPSNRHDDYESYFIEPDKPNAKIQITEIPSRGTFLHWTGTPADRMQDDRLSGETLAAVHGETPPLRVVRSITEDAVQPERNGHRARGRRQFLQNTLGAVGTAVTGGIGGVVANALSGAMANVGGAVSGAGGAVAGAVGNVFGNGGGGGGGGGGGRPQVTVFVTRVDRTLDDRMTATLVPKNCMPSGVHVNALRPCSSAAAHPYASVLPYQKQEHKQWPGQEHGRPSVDATDIVSKVKGLVKDLIDARTTSINDNNSYRMSLFHYGPPV